MTDEVRKEDYCQEAQEVSMTSPSEGDSIAVWFSCGAASATAAKETIRLYGDTCNIRVVNNPVKEEDEDNTRFLKDVQDWLGVEIEQAINPKFPSCSAVDVWEKRQFMGNAGQAPCTSELKKNARRAWEMENDPDWTVLGFVKGEEHRHEYFDLNEGRSLPVLIDNGFSKGDCYRYILEAGLELPRTYLRGYPNANCIGCVKATSPTYWNHVRKKDPDVFWHRATQSRSQGAKLVRYKGRRIFLDELPEDAKGRPMKDMNFECGITCE